MSTSARPARPSPVSDIELVLLGSLARSRIVAGARGMCHRRIWVIEHASATTSRAARAAGLRQSVFELCARLDVELPERLPQVVLHGAGADEQAGGDLSTVGRAPRQAR